MRSAILCIFIALSISSLKAQRLAGGEIYYELIGQSYYKVTAHVYRACDGNPLNNLSGFVVADTIRQSMTFARTAIQKISDTCGKPCNKINDVGNPGFEKHSFVAYVDFKNSSYSKFISAGKCFVHFAIKQGGRDNRTTTHGTGMFYLDAGTYICDTNVRQNHSPVFSMEPKFLANCNQPLRYSPGPLDSSDYDSLAFSLEPVQVEYQKSILYTQGYSATQPLTPYCPPNPGALNCRGLPNTKPPRGFSFDGNFCQIVFTPNNCAEMGYVRIMVKEFRKINNQWVYLGFVSREMRVTVANYYTNNSSQFNIVNGTYFNLCSSPLTLNLKTTDEPFLPIQTTYDTTFIIWDRGYRSASMTIYDTSRLKSAGIDLQPDPALIGKPAYFTVGTFDRLCNNELSSVSFRANNLQSLTFSASYTIDTCGIFKYQIKPADTTLTYWHNVNILDSTGKPLATAYSIYPFNTRGKHIIEYVASISSQYCPSKQYDTIQVNYALSKAGLNISKDTTVCPGYPANLIFSPSKIKNLADIRWFINNNLVQTADSVYAFTVNGPVIVSVLLRDQKNCFSEKEIRFNTKLPGTNLLPDAYNSNCPGDSFTVTANLSAALKAPVRYIWTYEDQTDSASAHVFRFKQGYFKTGMQGRVRVTAKDDNHCTVKDSALMYPLPYAPFKLLQDSKTTCIDSVIQMSATLTGTVGPSAIRWMRKGIDTLVNADTSYRFTIKQNTELLVQFFYNTCMVADSLTIEAIQNPDILGVAGNNALCSGDSSLLQLQLKPYAGRQNIAWYKNGLLMPDSNSRFLFKDTLSAQLRILVGNSGQCFTDTLLKATVYPPVQALRIVSDTFYNPLNHIVLSTDANYKTYIWFNGKRSRNDSFWASELGPPGTYKVWCAVSDSNGCSSSDTLLIFTDRRLNLQSTSHNKTLVYPNPFSNCIQVFTHETLPFALYSSEGKLLASGTLQTGLNSIDSGTLPIGLYLLKCGDYSHRLIKE